MRIIVTGMPRTRSTLIVNHMANTFGLDKPVNFWGETHRFGETTDTWLSKDNVVFKCWPAFTENYIDILEKFDGNIIVTYTTDIPVFVAKVIRAEISKDWGITPRDLRKITYDEALPTLTYLTPTINSFIDGFNTVMRNETIRRKSIFVCDKSCSAVANGTLDRSLMRPLEVILSEYVRPALSNYISSGEDQFVNYVTEHLSTLN